MGGFAVLEPIVLYVRACCLLAVTMVDIVLPSLAFEDDAPDMMDMSDAESISDGVATDLHDVGDGADDDHEVFVVVHRGLDAVIEQMDALEAWEQANPNALDVGAVGGAQDREVAANAAEDVADELQFLSMLITALKLLSMLPTVLKLLRMPLTVLKLLNMLPMVVKLLGVLGCC